MFRLEQALSSSSVVSSAGFSRRKECAPEGPCRLRLRFSRKGEAAALSHLEQIKALRGIASAAGLPALVAGGHPKMSFGPAVAQGYESEAEYADLTLTRPVKEKEAFDSVSRVCSGGYSLLEARRIPAAFPSIEALVNCGLYEISFAEADGAPALEEFLARLSIPVAKVKEGGREEVVDARPLIVSMKREGEGKLSLLLRCGPGRTLKPERVAEAWLGRVPAGVLRKALYWESPDGHLSAP